MYLMLGEVLGGLEFLSALVKQELLILISDGRAWLLRGLIRPYFDGKTAGGNTAAAAKKRQWLKIISEMFV